MKPIQSAAVLQRARASCSWKMIPSPNPGTPKFYNSLSAVAVVSNKDVWAVGTSYMDQEGGTQHWYFLHWNGTSWSVSRAPRGSGAIYDIAASSSHDVWAVGDHILHWDGSRWSLVPAADPGTKFWHFEGVSTSSATDVWAFGGTAPAPGGSLVEHWDGSAWSIVPSPSQAGVPFGELSAAAGQGNDIWAVGEVAPSAFDTLMEHWDGTRWSIVASPSVAAKTKPFDWLFSVASISPNDAWAVGSSGTTSGYGGGGDHPLIEHWDGGAWSVSHSPSLKTSGYRLSGVAAASASEVFAVGSSGSGHATTPLIERWNGRAWVLTKRPAPRGSSLSGIAASPAGGFWAVGSTMLGPSGPQRTLVMQCKPAGN